MSFKPLFNDCEEQISLVCQQNAAQGWGFPDALFATLPLPLTPVPSDRPLAAFVLVPYLNDWWRTFSCVWTSITWCSVADLCGFSPRNLRTAAGSPHWVWCLRWELIDLGAHRGTSIQRVWQAGREWPQVSLLAAAWLHPVWAGALGSADVPMVNLAGYEVTHPDKACLRLWDDVPVMGFDRYRQCLELGLHTRSQTGPGDISCVPELLATEVIYHNPSLTPT